MYQIIEFFKIQLWFREFSWTDSFYTSINFNEPFQDSGSAYFLFPGRLPGKCRDAPGYHNLSLWDRNIQPPIPLLTNVVHPEYSPREGVPDRAGWFFQPSNLPTFTRQSIDMVQEKT